MCKLGSYETNASHLCFFHKESTDVAPLKFKSTMCLSNLLLKKATFTLQHVCEGQQDPRHRRYEMETEVDCA
jgi:hypothetical protein